MTRRERLERKLENREAWADGRRAKADALHRRAEPYRGDTAFWTQPGHIPERARILRGLERAYEHGQVAAHHDSKAAGLEAQLDRSIFSDDDNAIAELEARIAEHEATRDRMVLVNKLFRKGAAAGLAELGIDLEQLRAKLKEAGAYWGSKPHLPYELSNLGARIRSDRERIKDIQARRARTERAESSAGGVVIEGETWVRVTFAEKPARAILDALKAAGFRWGQGSWMGERAKLPEGIL